MSAQDHSAPADGLDYSDDHAALVDEQIVERYLMGRLPREEAQRFESHYLDCPTCLELLEVTEAMLEGLHHHAARRAIDGSADSAWLKDPSSTASSPARTGFRRRRAWSLAAALLLSVGALASWHGMQLQHDLNALKRELSALRSPQLSPVDIVLSPHRDGSRSATPLRQLRKPSEPRLLMFWLELGLEPETPCLLSVEDGSGRLLWRSSEARADSRGRLNIAFPSEFFEPGDVLLQVDSPDGNILARIPLTVLAAR